MPGMDDGQTNPPQGVQVFTYNAMKNGVQAEWLLNYRGGSFLLRRCARAATRRAALDGISIRDHLRRAARRHSSGDSVAGNMESVPLEKAARMPSIRRSTRNRG